MLIRPGARDQIQLRVIQPRGRSANVGASFIQQFKRLAAAPNNSRTPLFYLDLDHLAPVYIHPCFFYRIEPQDRFAHLRRVQINRTDRKINMQNLANILRHIIAGAADRH